MHRNSVLHLALFVPWERFQKEPAHDNISRLWRSFAESLGDRLRSYVRNIALLRVSADDARGDRKMQGIDEEFEDTADTHAFEDQGGEEEEGVTEDNNIDSEDYHDAFLGILSAVRNSEIKDMPVISELNCLDEEARAIDMVGENGEVTQRGRQFYTMLQDVQDSPFRGMGLLSREEIDAISKVQKKEDASVKANIHGEVSNALSMHVSGPDKSPNRLWQRANTETEPTDGADPRGQMRLEVGPYTSYVDVAQVLARRWTLNKLLFIALLLPAVFLNKRGTRL